MERMVKDDITVYHIHIDNPQNFYLLMHECVHIVNRIFEDRDIYYDKAEDELFAYYLTFWFKKLWRYYGNIK